MLQQLRQAGFQRLRFRRFAVGHGELSQTQTEWVRDNVEHVDGIALGIVPLLAGLAVGGRRDGQRGLRQSDQPASEDIAELLQRESRHGAADGRGMRRLFAGKAQGALEDPPMIVGPTLQRGKIGLATE